MGSCADFLHDGWVAYLCGCFIGVLSCLLFEFVPRVFDKLGIHDVAGVFNLHGIPGMLGGLLSAIIRAVYVEDKKGGLQVAGTFISIGIGLLGGIVVGLITRFLHAFRHENQYFNDKKTVVLEEFIVKDLQIYGGPHSGVSGSHVVDSGNRLNTNEIFTSRQPHEEQNKFTLPDSARN